MKNILILIIMLSLCSGCAGGSKGTARPAPPTPPGPSAQLASARQSLSKGDPVTARKLLVAVCDSLPIAGVTDEALFRLALLTIRTGGDSQPLLLLRRLKKEFPTSEWTVQAQPLVEYLAANDELRRQMRTLRTQREALGRENSELRGTVDELNKKVDVMKQNIEQMKHLDLELERKSR